MRTALDDQHKKRMEAFELQFKPIIIRDGPSKKVKQKRRYLFCFERAQDMEVFYFQIIAVNAKSSFTHILSCILEPNVEISAMLLVLGELQDPGSPGDLRHLLDDAAASGHDLQM